MSSTTLSIMDEATKRRLMTLVGELFDHIQDDSPMTPERRRFHIKVTRLLKGILSAYDEFLRTSS